MNATGVRECNPGGPRSRVRKEPLKHNLLGDAAGPIRCPRVHRLGLAFGDASPLAVAETWLEALGFANEEVARAAFDLPDQAMICQPDPEPQPLTVAELHPRDGMRIALMLGLCSQHLYAPERPVLWTTRSLSRHLLLFEPAGFYA